MIALREYLFKKNYLYILVGLAVIILAYKNFHRFHPSPQESPIIVSTSKIVRQDVQNKLNLIATVIPYESVAIKARLDSQIMEVLVKDGQSVKKGDILFQLDNRLLKAELARLQAVMKSNEAELERAQTDLGRARNLSDKGVASQQAYDKALTTFKTAEASWESTKAQIENVKTQLDFTTIRAPIEGRIGTIQSTVGNTVKANDTVSLATINKVKPIKVKISIPQRYYEEIRKNLKDSDIDVIVSSTSGEVLEKGKTIFKENIIDDTTRTLAVTASFDNKDEKLWPGMFVDASLILGMDKQVLTVPITAVLPGETASYIFVVKNNKAIRKAITLIRSVEDIALIKGEGIEEGDDVINNGLLRVRDGKQVTIKAEQKELEAKKKP